MREISIQGVSDLVRRHRPCDPGEADSVARVLDLLGRAPEPFSRKTEVGHITASAVVLDPSGRALLLFHARLGIWVQPGGHVEETDTDVAAAALREAREESGLHDLRLESPSVYLDVDVHRIPASAKRQEPEHWHHDLCFLARTNTARSTRIDPEESHDFRWVTAAELEGLSVDGATRRRLLKAFALPR